LYQERSNRTISPAAGRWALALRRRRQRGDPPDARARALGDALDDAALARRVATLEDDDDPQSLGLDVLLQQHELALQADELLVEDLAVELLGLG
jgi:hypothetical protein